MIFKPHNKSQIKSGRHIHSLNRCLLSIYSLPSSELGSGEAAVEKTLISRTHFNEKTMEKQAILVVESYHGDSKQDRE